MVSGFIKRFVKKKPSDQTELGGYLGKIKEELNDHLDTLNANTQELQVTYEYLCQLEEKIDKLNEKIESIQFNVGMGNQFEKRVEDKTKFSLREQEVFLVFYTSNIPLSIQDVARKLGFSEYQIQRHLDELIRKKVPILKNTSGKMATYVLHPEFKQLQAKKNVIGINEVIAKQFT